MKLAFYVISFLVLLLFNGCKGNDDKEKRIREFEMARIKENEYNLDKLNQKYRDIPDERIMENNGANSALYAELKDRYLNYLTQLKTEVEGTGAKFVVMIMKPIEKPGDAIQNFKAGRPFIISSCAKLGIDCYDLSSEIDAQNPREITLLPRDGHWSKKGGEFFAGLFLPIAKKYENNKSTVTYKPSERPETFGDLLPNQDEFLDGGKDIPYHMKANAQGLRMDYNLEFPKTKPRILFMGSSHIYFPFLDNEFIATSVLQKQMPEAEILNAGILSATIDDYVSLFKEKARYAEPDVVILQTNGGDIIHLFFSNRNHLSRNRVPHYPTPLEEKYYHNTYNY
jgi:hypothetical protein